jgi:hypothetical protein
MYTVYVLSLNHSRQLSATFKEDIYKLESSMNTILENHSQVATTQARAMIHRRPHRVWPQPRAHSEVVEENMTHFSPGA